MSSTTPLFPFSIDSEQEELIQEECKSLISLLPEERWYDPSYLYKYKGFWLGAGKLRAFIACQRHFEVKDTDVLLITTPKSGTTWLKALMFTLLNRNKYPINQNHPLLHQNPHDLVPFMEHFISPNYKGIPSLSFGSGRLFATHCPLTLLPNSVLNSDCKIVYQCRNLKDLSVSYWHFMKKVIRSDFPLEEFFDKLCNGVTFAGPIWDHVLEYWKESLEQPDKVLFLKYEALREQPEFQLRRLAEFIGCPISPEEETTGLVGRILGLCSFDHLSNLEVNKTGKWKGLDNQAFLDNQSFFRKGEIGDWRNYLTSGRLNGLIRSVRKNFMDLDWFYSFANKSEEKTSNKKKKKTRIWEIKLWKTTAPCAWL